MFRSISYILTNTVFVHFLRWRCTLCVANVNLFSILGKFQDCFVEFLQTQCLFTVYFLSVKLHESQSDQKHFHSVQRKKEHFVLMSLWSRITHEAHQHEVLRVWSRSEKLVRPRLHDSLSSENTFLCFCFKKVSGLHINCVVFMEGR